MTDIKVAHLHTVDQAGGGAKIVRNLHKQLNKDTDFDSSLFVGEKKTNINKIIELPSLPLEEEFTKFFEHILSLEGLASPSSLKSYKYIFDSDPDIIHLHNIHGNYFNFMNLSRFPKDIPVVWTFHDMWPLTGRCVYSYDCSKYTKTCQDCPYLETSKKVMFDSTKQLHKLKKKIFTNCDPHIVVPSKWMLNKVNQSHFDDSRVDYITHGINEEFFSPQVKNPRKKFDLPNDKVVILFVSNGLSTPRKGMRYLASSLEKITDNNVVLFAVGGSDLPNHGVFNKFDTYTPGYIKNSQLPAAYSSADFTVVPSLYESFGLVATESMSCGTPVVAFDTSGLKEQITGSTGWLAEFKSSKSLSKKIREAIQNKQHRETKGKEARKRILNKYTQNRFVNEYKNLYNRITNT
jgi:glycosyltransferase involved in cell wall biosynthesis